MSQMTNKSLFFMTECSLSTEKTCPSFDFNLIFQSNKRLEPLWEILASLMTQPSVIKNSGLELCFKCILDVYVST